MILCCTSIYTQIEVEKRWKREREATRKRGKKQRKRDRNSIHTEMEIEGDDEAWDTERETKKRKRQNIITVRFSTAIRSLAKLKTQELRLNDSERTSVCHRWWREKNLRRKSSFATIRPPYPPPVWSRVFFFFLVPKVSVLPSSSNTVFVVWKIETPHHCFSYSN